MVDIAVLLEEISFIPGIPVKMPVDRCHSKLKAESPMVPWRCKPCLKLAGTKVTRLTMMA